jgi:hypothetical protein
LVESSFGESSFTEWTFSIGLALDPVNKALGVELMLTIQLGNLLMQPKFLKTETALCGILNISVRTKLIRRLLRPSVFMHLDIVILG